MTHEVEVHYQLKTHDGHAAHHDEDLLKHLEEDDGHGPAADRPKPSTTVKPPRASRSLQAYCDMKPNKALQRSKHNIVGRVIFSQSTGGPLNIQVNLKGLRTTGTSLHGFHVHELIPTEEGNCNTAGSHFNPLSADHGGPAAQTRYYELLSRLLITKFRSEGMLEISETFKQLRIAASAYP